MTDRGKAMSVLTMNTIAFTICFACWMAYSILIAHLVKIGAFDWDAAQIGTLLAIPVLTGSLTRLPLGMLTDMFGGRVVFSALMLVSAVPMYLVSHAQSYHDFWWAGLGFGLTGASFAVGIAYTSAWFPKQQQGTVLGIFGAGNIGAAVTTLGAPILLHYFDSWRTLPKIYAALLVVMAISFFVLTHPKKAEESEKKNLKQRIIPLRNVRVWRFGLYYFLVFGGFVAMTSWLPVYYINVYELNLVTVGILTSAFVLPAGLIRAVGGWLSDRWGARKVMYWVLGSCALGCSALILPRSLGMSPWLFIPIVFVIGIAMGIGSAAVYKHIPDYFPNEVGVVGGMVGVLGGLGGYFCPKVFGLLLDLAGAWTTCWIFLAVISMVSLAWMHSVVTHMKRAEMATLSINGPDFFLSGAKKGVFVTSVTEGN
jgi:MFS transporter, NNP family, nitrate/nitrite transporter